MKTLFQKIADREIPADIVYEDEQCLAFRDITPQAPTHILIIPKKHIGNINLLEENDTVILANIIKLAKNLAQKAQIDVSGYRLVVNSGPDSGQEVDHLHCHLLGGKKLNDIA